MTVGVISDPSTFTYDFATYNRVALSRLFSTWNRKLRKHILLQPAPPTSATRSPTSSGLCDRTLFPAGPTPVSFGLSERAPGRHSRGRTSGIAAALALKDIGLRPLVLDRADRVASSWRSRYDRLRLNTCRPFSHLPDRRFARGTPMFPTRDQIVDYLELHAH